MIQKVEHIGIMVADINRSIAFYRDILGLSLIDQRTAASGAQLAFFRIGDVEIELVASPTASHYQGDGIINHLTFTVTDLDAAMAHLRTHEVEMISQEPIPIWDGMRVAFFRGPDGEKLEFFERKLPRQ